jgi:hypothetical protein
VHIKVEGAKNQLRPWKRLYLEKLIVDHLLKKIPAIYGNRRLVAAFTTAGTHCIGDWVDPRAGLHDVEKREFLMLPVLELRPLGRPALSQSQYQLRHPGSL